MSQSFYTPTSSGKLETCPYDKSHRVELSRYQTHVVKCRKNYPDTKKAQCLFNATHWVNEPEMKHHTANCPDKYLLDRHLYVPEDVDVEKYPVKNNEVGDDECWNDDPAPQAYNPEEHCTKSAILRKMDVASGAQRRQFRHEERKRFHQFNDGHIAKKDAAYSRRPIAQSSAMEPPPPPSWSHSSGRHQRFNEHMVPDSSASSVSSTTNYTTGLDTTTITNSSWEADSARQRDHDRSPRRGPGDEDFQVVNHRRFGKGRGRAKAPTSAATSTTDDRVGY